MTGQGSRPSYSWLLSKWIEDSGLTLRELADRCGGFGEPITYSYISKVRAGKLPPPSSAVTNVLASALGKDPTPLHTLTLVERLHGDWKELFWSLISLVMDPARPLVEQLEDSRIRDLPKILTEVLRGQISAGDVTDPLLKVTDRALAVAAIQLRNVLAPTRNVLSVLLLDAVPEQPLEYLATFGSFVSIDRSVAADADYALRIKDSSMSDMGIWSGDTLLVHQGSEGVSSGEMVLARVHDQVIARRCYVVDSNRRLEPALMGGVPLDQEQVEILGVVRGLLRTM